MWLILAILSAVFAAITSILMKMGMQGVDTNLATAIRTAVVLGMACGIVLLKNTQSGITQISRRGWVFMILSGVATGISWLLYYQALNLGQASKVEPVSRMSVALTLVLAVLILHEEFGIKSVLGAVFITLGTVLMVLQ